MNLTASQLASVRSHPHRTRLYLSVFKPVEVFSGLIADSELAKGDRTFIVSGTSGQASDVLRGMTCYVGTTPGACDVERIRAIEATASTITVAENSRNWVNGQYLTVVRYFEPWGVFPRITLDADNVPQFFKDFDIPYTDQNQLLDPVVCMGPNHAAFLEPTITGSYARVWYTTSGSFDPTPQGSISSYRWWFQGGNPTGSVASVPGYVDYTGCGSFITECELTTAAGKSFTGYRHVSIYARPESTGPGDVCKPITRFGFDSLAGDRESGGYEARIWVRENVSLSDFCDGSLVVIFSEDWEGYNPTKVGANAERRDNILFVGYIEDDTITLDPVTNKVEFTAQSISLKMDRLSTFSAALDDALNAVTWNQMREMTLDRGIIHFLRWHSTVMAVTDFSPSYDVKPVQYLDFSRGSIFEGVDGLLDNALIGGLVSDRQGKLWAEVDARVLTTGTFRRVEGSMQTVLDSNRSDWRNQMTIQRLPQSELSFLELGGIAYTGVTGGATFSAHLAGAPGFAPDYYGVMERRTGMIITGQDQLNEVTGHAWAARNAEFPEVDMPLAGDYRFLDIAPQHRVLLTMGASENFRGVTLNQRPFIPQGISYQWLPSEQALLMDLKLAEETFGLPADTIDIPVDPPYSSPGEPDFDFDFPPILPPPSVPPPSSVPGVSTGQLVYMATRARLVRSRNFGPTGTTAFTDITPSLVSVTGTYIGFRLDPNNPKNVAYLMTSTGNAPNGTFIYKTVNLNSVSPTWTPIMTPAIWNGSALFGNEASNNGISTIWDFAIVRGNSNIIYAQGAQQNPVTGDRMRIAVTLDGGASWDDAGPSPYNVIRGFNTLQIAHPGEHGTAGLIAWSSRGNGESDPQGILFTQDRGASWSIKRDTAAVNDMEVPFNANAADQIVYWSEGDGASKKLYITTNNFNTVLEITPAAAGNNWAVRRLRGVGGTIAGDQKAIGSGSTRQIRTWDQNGLFVAAILQRQIAEAADSNDSLYFFATDGQTLQPTRLFTGNVTSLWWNKNNVNQLYMICITDATNVSAIYFTNDGGLTWVNLFGSWYRDIKLSAGNQHWDGERPFTIQNVWTE
jgi:hypothetical protein